MDEIWKPIAGYENLYEISNLGMVKSLKRDVMIGNTCNVRHLPERLLKLATNSVGYLQVCLCKDGKLKWHRVHRLVAQAFLPNPDNLPEVNHKDEDKMNNRVDNLEWCDRYYNTSYGTLKQRTSMNPPKPVLQLNLDGDLIKEWRSINEVAKQCGYCTTSISNCCVGGYTRKGKWYNSHTYKGYKWEWAS